MTPNWVKTARAQLGVREAPGPANSNVIMGWAAKVSRFLGIAYTADSVPWCGLFIAYVMATSGITPPKIAVRAKAWADWGIPCDGREGAVLVFDRAGGGHVGLYVGETEGRAGHYKVLGGNQSDAVTETWIEKSRCVAVRWPAGVPVTGNRIILAKAGALSRKEA